MEVPFLRIPPFPGHRAQPLALIGTTSVDSEQAEKLIRVLRDSRVGGNFWGRQPAMPKGRNVVLAPSSRHQALEMLDAASAEGRLDHCVMIESSNLGSFDDDAPILSGSIDHWHVAEAAEAIWVDADHELALVGSLIGRPVRMFGVGRFSELSGGSPLSLVIQQDVSSWTYACPFSGDPIEPVNAIELLSGWRRLIDRNRQISCVLGVAGWKRPTVDPMLWDGASLPHHAASLPAVSSERRWVATWKSRTAAPLLDRISEVERPVAEIEDGMIRGRGLGANCVPPLSIVVDFSGIYFDPAGPSDLEAILESTEMDGALLDRAARLREMIVEAGISKYGGGSRSKATSGTGRRILVVGQVEDDRSILSGGSGQTNLELLQRARSMEPDAWLIYRPHPDVEAGHRKGHIPDQEALRLTDEIERGGSISDLLESVDEVHCITSLAGFEALLRGKKVTTHGVPFYAGWGLTTDLGPIPSRRTRRRSIDELVAATLILYPTYVDPVTRLPCSPEILVERIARGEEDVAAPLAGLRMLQGKVKLALRRLREAAA